jgi:hypothetical protein
VARTLLVSKLSSVGSIILCGALAFAGAGAGHSHGNEGDQNMQAIGIFVILAFAGFVIWFLSNRTK